MQTGYVPTRGNELAVPLPMLPEPTSRSVSDVVITGKLELDALDAEALTNWSSSYSSSQPGDVEAVRLSDGFGQHEDVRPIEEAILKWAASENLSEVFADAHVAPLVCQGANFHSDGVNFPGEAFCIVWISEQVGLDLLFPNINVRVPLEQGTVVLFDPAQPHGVVVKGASEWDAGVYYEKIVEPTQHLVSFDLDLLHDQLRQRMAVNFQPHGGPSEGRDIRKNGKCVKVDHLTGMWKPTDH
jgi:hypothetical protein